MTEAAPPPAPALSPQQLDECHQKDLANGRPLAEINAERLSWKREPLSGPADPVAAYQAERLKPEVRIQELKRDPGFVQRLMSGDMGAKAEWDQVHIAAANGQLLPPAEKPAAPAASTTPEAAAAAEIDQGFPPAKAHQFDIGAHFKNEQGEVDATGRAGHEATAAWLETMKLPAGIGTAAIKSIADFSPRWQAMDEGARSQHAHEVREQLTRMWGSEAATARVSMANELIREVEKSKPGLVAMLEKSGAVSDLGTVVNLGLHAERMFARRGITIDSIMAKLKTSKGS